MPLSSQQIQGSNPYSGVDVPLLNTGFCPYHKAPVRRGKPPSTGALKAQHVLVFNVAEGHERHILALEQAHHLPGTQRGHLQPYVSEPCPEPKVNRSLVIDFGQELPV